MTYAALVGLFLIIAPGLPDATPLRPTTVIGLVLVAAATAGRELCAAIRGRDR